MPVVRRNIVTNTAARDAYVKGVNLLKQQQTNRTTTDFGIEGRATPVRVYDLFVIWHHRTMSTPVPPGGQAGTRNAAHRGPVFLPWHRMMLRFLELNLQRVLRDPSFGLPYWDWSADGTPAPGANAAAPENAKIWKEQWMGGEGDPVNTGPFAFDKGFRIRVASGLGGTLVQANRGLRRNFGGDAPGLPTVKDVERVVTARRGSVLGTYDTPSFDAGSEGFRNTLEGFKGPGLHNQVHRWVHDDMAPAHSPNDPVFFLHHCNVDRIWEGWMRDHGRVYLPDMTASAQLQGHRIDDPIVSPLGPGATPRSLLDQTRDVTYDAVP